MFAWVRILLACLALALPAWGWAPVRAASVPPGERFATSAAGGIAGAKCSALAPEGIDPRTLARSWAHDPARWTCSGKAWPIDGARASLIRIDMRGKAVSANAVLTTRLTRYRSLSITAVGANGRFASRTITPDMLVFSTTQWKMRMPLPRLDGPVEAYILKVTGARHAGLLSDATIGPPPDEAAVGNDQLILAMLGGLMLMPLILSVMFYRILRQPFILWHGAAVLSMLTQTLVSCGLINRFATLSSTQLCALSTLTWACMIICTLRFFIGLIEPDMISRTMRRALEWLGPWFLFWSGYYTFADGPFLASVAPLYYLAFLPVIVVLVIAVISAALRGSRQIWFQIVGWTPLMLLGLARIVSILGLTDAPLGLMVEQHIAIVIEVVVTTLSAADRIMAIRNERDQARADARLHANLASHDALTGLLNRRAVEARFPALYQAGFQSMAAIDLDHFKQINDTHGHAVGDDVLRAVAEALRYDQDTIAVRMGGEEFLLLLRGEDVLERAERLRQAIPSRVAKLHPDLARLVTASMGVFLKPPQTRTAPRFAEIYERCDDLLYASKAAGRNCMRSNVDLPITLVPLEKRA